MSDQLLRLIYKNEIFLWKAYCDSLTKLTLNDIYSLDYDEESKKYLKKWWHESHPKYVVKCKLYVTPIRQSECVKINCIVTKDGIK